MVSLVLPVSHADEHPDAEEYNMVAAGSSKQAFDICIEKWKDYWNYCVQSSGSYYDNSD